MQAELHHNFFYMYYSQETMENNQHIFEIKIIGCLDWVDRNDEMERWNGMECGKQRSEYYYYGVCTHCSYHLSSYNRFLVCALGYCQGGDGLRGLEHSFAQGMS